MANDFLTQWRAANPDDARSDSELILSAGDKDPLLLQDPSFKADYDRADTDYIRGVVGAPSTGDYLKQAAGSALRGAGNTLASVPKGLALAASYLDEKVLDLSPGSNAPKDKGLYQLGEAGTKLVNKVAPEEVESLKDSWVATKIPQGIGSALAFLANGAAGAAAKAPAWLTAGTLGTLSTYDDQYSDAKAKGATEEQALTAALASTPFGASEAVPMAKWITRVSKAAGVPVKKFLFEAGKETLEEGLQEWFQQTGQNLVAKGIYDPERDIFQGSGENAAVGGATGLFMSLLTHSIGHALSKKSSGESASSNSKGDERSATVPAPNAPATGTEPISSPIDLQAQIVSARDLTPDQRSFVAQVIAAEIANPEDIGTQTALKTIQADPAMSAYYAVEKPVAVARYLDNPPFDEGSLRIPSLDQSPYYSSSKVSHELPQSSDDDRQLGDVNEHGKLNTSRTAPASSQSNEPPKSHTRVAASDVSVGEHTRGESREISQLDSRGTADNSSSDNASVGPYSIETGIQKYPAASHTLSKSYSRDKANIENEYNSSIIRRDELRRAAAAYGQVDPFAEPTPLAKKVEAAAAKTDTEPTEAEKESGDYEKGTVKIGGMTISIETPKGATRSGVSVDGTQWSVVMPAHYGEIHRTEGADGDKVDIYVGPHPDSKQVFVVDQINPDTGKFDEHKAMLGFESQGAAEGAYQQAFSDGMGAARMGAVAPMTVEQFEQWAKKGDTGSPLAYVEQTAPEVKTNPVNTLVDSLAWDTAKLVANDTRRGQGTKTEPVYRPNPTPTELVKDARADGSNKNETRKLAVLLSPDGQTVIVASASENGGVRRVSVGEGKRAGKPVLTLLEEGYKLIGALKTAAPTNNYRVTYSVPEWNAAVSQITGRQGAETKYTGLSQEQEAALGRVTEGGELADAPGMSVVSRGQLAEPTVNRNFGKVLDEPMNALAVEIARDGWDSEGEALQLIKDAMYESPEIIEALKNLVREQAARGVDIDTLEEADKIAEAIYVKSERIRRTGEVPSRAAQPEGATRNEGHSQQGERAADEGDTAESDPSFDDAEDYLAHRGVGTSTRDGRATSSEFHSKFFQIIDALQAFGVPTQLVREQLGKVFYEWGAFSRENGREMVTLSIADALNPSPENLRTLLHEAFHAVFSRESAEMQAYAHEAIDRASDEVLGVNGFAPKISEGSTATMSEERLAESMAREFEAKGIDRSVAATIWRVLKALMLRTAMAVQRMLNLRPSANVARAYFRVRMAQALSTQPTSLTAWLGGPVPTKAEQLDHFTRLRGSDLVGELFNYETGRIEVQPALVDSVAAARFNTNLTAEVLAHRRGDDLEFWKAELEKAEQAHAALLAAPIRDNVTQGRTHEQKAKLNRLAAQITRIKNSINYHSGGGSDLLAHRSVGTTDISTISPDLDSTAQRSVEVAYINAHQDTLRALFDQWESMNLNTTKLTFEQWLESGNFVKFKDHAAEQIKAINYELTQAGKPPINPAFSITGLPDESKKTAAVAWNRLQRGLRSWLSKRHSEAVEARTKEADALNRSNVKLQEILTHYTNAETVLAAARREVRASLQEVSDEAKSIKSAAYKSGTLMQVIREMNGRMDRPAEAQMRAALEKLYKKFSGDEGGRQFFDVLQRVAELGIAWDTASIGDIRDVIKIHAAAEPLLAPLLETDTEGRALMATVIAYAKRNQVVMGMLELRRAKADTERTAVNQLLRDAMGSSRDAIKDAKQAAKKLPRLGALADRLLSRLQDEKERNRELLASLQRHRTFIDFHQETWGVLENEIARSGKIFGDVDAAWEATHLAEYQVPPSPTATLAVLADKANTKTLRLESNGKAGAQVRDHIIKMTAWLDAQPADQRGYVWNTMAAQRDKLGLLDKSFLHTGLRSNVSDRLLGSITAKLDGIGHPATKEAARRLRQVQFHIATYTKGSVETGGVKWSVARGDAMKALGLNSDEFMELRGRSLDYISSRADLFAGQDEAAATTKALSELRDYLERDPATLKRAGAWPALEKFLRADQRNSAELKTVHKALGLKAEDGGIFRDLVGASLARVPRGFSDESQRVYEVMRGLGWLDKDLKFAELFNADPVKFQSEIAKRFTPEVWQSFLRELVNMPGRSLFNAPKGVDGLYRLAMQERTRQAFEASAPGDVVDFIQKLYTIEGGTTDLAEFVGETMETLQNYFNLLHRAHQEKAYSGEQGAPLPGNALLDARQTDEMPPAWLKYISLDAHHMKQVVTSMAFEAGAGRDMKGIRSNFHTANEQLQSRVLELKGITDKLDKSGLKGRFYRAELKKQAEAIGGAGYLTVLETAEKNQRTVKAMRSQFDAILKGMFSDVPMEVRPFMQLTKMIAAWTVQGPGTALSDTISIIEQPLRLYGFNAVGLKAAAANVQYSGADALNMLLQAFGRKMRLDADNVERRADLGLVDTDATLRLKEKVLAAAGDDTNLGSEPVTRMGKLGRYIATGVTKTARVSQVALNTGIGRAAPGVAPVTTLKPGAAFTQAAQHQHAGVISGTWKMFEDMMGRALEHFASNPAALADPDFQFKPSDLGYSKGFFGMFGSEKALDYMRDRLLKNGMELENMAKKLHAARLADPNAPTFTHEQYRSLAVQGINETMLESNFTTRMPSILTNPWVAAASPLVGWSISKTAQLAGGFRTAEGKQTWGSFRAGMSVYAALLPLALAYAWLRDEYDEEVLGKKANVQGFGGNNNFLAALEKVGRMGTLGAAGDVLNGTLNMDTQRPFTVDTRVMFVSSIIAGTKAVGTMYRQGTADYATVGRPLVAALGGSGYLQYADILNNALSLDNAESRVVARINVSNLLRAAGRETGMDVRTGHNQVMPTTHGPWIGQMVMAAYANDAAGFREAYNRARLEAREAGHEDADAFVARSYSSRNPWRTTFQTAPTQQQINRALTTMSDDGRVAVNTATHLFNRYAEMIHATSFTPKASAPVSAGNRLEAFRRSAASYGTATF